MSSTSAASRPERSTAAVTTCSARVNGSTSTSVPLNARPIGVRAVETITASGMAFFLVGLNRSWWTERNGEISGAADGTDRHAGVAGDVGHVHPLQAGG